jgi:hypothetical protein
MSTEQNIQPRLLEPGYNIIQGRGGQALVLDVVGNMFLTSPNKPNEQQSELSIDKSVSSIAIMVNTGSIINTFKKYPSENFNTINQDQNIEENKVIIQSVQPTASSDLNVAVDVLPTSSVTSSVQTQVVEKPKSNKEIEVLFLPETEDIIFSPLYDENIIGIPLIRTEPLSLGFITIEGISFNENNTPNVNGYICGKIKNNKKTFRDIFIDIVNNFEGGYFNTIMFEDGRIPSDDPNRSKYKTSGETLFGIDRINGPQTEAALKFWKYVDSLKPNGKSKWEYLSHGPENNKAELYKLGAKILEPKYIQKWNNIPSNLRKIIESDGRLHTALAYGVWNGDLYYNKYIELITAEYNNGITNPTELLKKHIEHRKDVNKYFPKRPPHAKNILKTGGFAVEKTTGLNCTR